MKIKSFSVVASACAMIMSGGAQAAAVSLSNISAEWYAATPAANVTYYNNPSSTTAQARWGDNGSATANSGYDFAIAAQPVTFSLPAPPSASGLQVLGTFTHQNFAISAGTSISGIKLKLTADVQINGDPTLIGKTFNYAFDHWETTNNANPCADGGSVAPNVPTNVNRNGCADRVIANWAAESQSFLVGSEVYTLNINGFSLTADGANPFTSFWTAESARNDAFLLASVALRSEVEQVPEPGSIALAGLALAGLAVSRRSKAVKA
jgi:hypothetical protein